MENTFRARPVCFSLGLISLAKPVSKSIRLAVSGRSWTEFGQWAGWAGPKILSACSVLLAAAGGQRAVECKRPFENLRVYLFFFPFEFEHVANLNALYIRINFVSYNVS